MIDGIPNPQRPAHPIADSNEDACVCGHLAGKHSTTGECQVRGSGPGYADGYCVCGGFEDA